MLTLLRKFETYLLTEKRVALNTYKAYSADCAQFAQFLHERTLSFEHITQQILTDFLSSLYDRGMSAQSVCRKIAALKVFFAYCHERYGYPNIGEQLTFPQTEDSLPLFCHEPEIQALLSASKKSTRAKNERTYLIILLLYTSGMRVSELCSISISDIDWHTGTLRIMGKGSKMRMIPLPLQCMQEIKRYVDTYQPMGYLFSVVYGKKVKPISRQTVYTAIKSVVKEAAARSSISPHTLRHSLATHLLKLGWDLRSLQLLLGHENLTTVQIYTHIEKSDLQALYNKKHPRA